jgi:ferric-chelate reductase
MIFGRTTRLQLLTLAALAGYLLIFSFVGITYNTWITPVSDMPGVYNTRSSIGPWSDRIGVFAYALLPLSILLSNRESLLSLITGLPYQSFNFLHRWLGYIIFVQSAMHTIMWCIVELRLYQPQPSVGIEWVTQTYMVWGIVAMILLILLFALSTPWGIRMTGYETFRKAHYVLAMVFIGACWGHWEQLKCFLLPSLIFWFLDRGARLARTALLHYHPDEPGMLGFKTVDATITRYPDTGNSDVIRLDMDNIQEPWAIGQHYYLCFTQGSIWQSHPFTPLNAPTVTRGKVRHSYILRAKKGETKTIVGLAAAGISSTPVILTGAYGENITESLTPDTNIVCVAGGTGITYVLPVLLELARQSPSPDRKMELIWAIRHTSNTDWISEELGVLQKAQNILNLKIRIFATRDCSDASAPASKDGNVSVSVTGEEKDKCEVSPCSPSESQSCGCTAEAPVEKLGGESEKGNTHPDLHKLIPGFLNEVVKGPTTVFVSGPGGMISDVRDIVVSCSSGSKVWSGQERFDVSLVCDDRLEW